MLQEYAVDPTNLGRYGNLWQLLDQFGVSQGRLVAAFPSKWCRVVYDAMSDAGCPEMEKHKLIEKLNQLKKTSLTKGLTPRQYQGSCWFDAALYAHNQSPFSAILTEKKTENQPSVLNPIDAFCGHELWKVPTGKVIPRTAEAIAECALPLGRISKELLFVDPYLGTDNGDRLSVIKEIIRGSAVTGKIFRRVEMHVSEKSGLLKKMEKAVRKQLIKEVPSLPEIRILKWKQKSLGDRMHPRYFLTERGGIRFDYGLSKGERGETTDVQLLDDDLYLKRWDNYQEATAAFDLADSVTIHSPHE